MNNFTKREREILYFSFLNMQYTFMESNIKKELDILINKFKEIQK